MKKLLILGGNSDIGIQLLSNIIDDGNFITHVHYNKKFLKSSKYLNIKLIKKDLNLVNKKNLLIRLKKRKILNRYDQFNTKFYDKVQKGFLKISNLKKKNYFIIDSNSGIKKNEDIVINQVQKLIK